MKRIHILLISLVILILMAWFTYTPAAVNFAFDLGRQFLGEAHTWTATQTYTVQQLFTGGSDSSPSIAFDDDGNSGILSDADNVVRYIINGSRVMVMTTTTFGANTSASGPGMINQISTRTNPGLLPRRGNPAEGLGSGGPGEFSAIANSLEMTRWDGTTDSGASMWMDGGIVIGDISGATVSPITGTTAFILIASGVSPAGGSGGSPTNAIQLYVTGNELFVADGNGTHTGLGSFNLQTGQATSKKWNVYTGKIVTRNWETGAVTVDSGTTRDWKVDQIANQKRAHIRSYTQQTIEVPQGQATKFGDIEIEDKLWWTVKYRFERGKKVEYNAYAKRVVKSKEKVLKPNHWMDEDGTFWRRRTKPEAIAAYAVDMASIGNKWDNLAPFLKAEIQDPRL